MSLLPGILGAHDLRADNSASATGDSAYQEAIAALNAHNARPIIAGEVVGLQRTSLLLQELGNPQLSFPVIHITGTVGKGSTARNVFIDAPTGWLSHWTLYLSAPGRFYRTHRYRRQGDQPGQLGALPEPGLAAIVVAMSNNALPGHPEYTLAAQSSWMFCGDGLPVLSRPARRLRGC